MPNGLKTALLLGALSGVLLLIGDVLGGAQGLMLGFVFARNFDSPYRSQSITEFWRRWHISLSTWLRDYLYVPLGGNRKGVERTYVNLLLTMLLGGLWHGAAWNFVVWGAYHGLLLAFERAVGVERLYGWMPRPLRRSSNPSAAWAARKPLKRPPQS